MSYALFSDTVQVSQAFRTKAEVWKHAAARGLVIEGSSSEEDPPRRILDMGYTIDASAPDIAEAAAHSDRGLSIIAGCEFNPRSAAVAS